MIFAHVLALAIFLATFYFIISGKLDRTIASFAGAIVMVTAGISLGFYSQEEAFHAIDFNMMGLLVGMMVIVSVCKKTGFFSYVAIKAAKASRGSPLRLMVMMGCITAFLSMALDNVTTIILVIPITILICDILGISPLPFIITEIVLSNVGGVGTMVGDPPNMMIASSANLSFNDFLIHLLPIVLVTMVLSLVVLAVVFRKEIIKKPKDFRPILEIDEKAAIRDKKSLKKVALSLFIVFVLFLLQKRLGLSHSFIAFIGAGIVMVLVRPNVEEVLKNIEWPIFVFFASLFIIVGGLEQTGFLNMVADRIVAIATTNYGLAKLSILWSSAFFASVVDRIPFTTAMIPIIKHVGELGVNVDSLWWILALGVGFGGNGTPIGSIVGVVGLAMSEKTRAPIDFKTWFKTATVVMLVTIIFVSFLIAII
ncbi:MAG: ArsB/NhaD family transporter [Candidatus Omnitrophica bacterium]|nr:ArsB/NhaD family transporter [Candidatus Omnitrophota bacterium]